MALLRAQLFLAWWFMAIIVAHGSERGKSMTVTFVNERPSGTIELFWENTAEQERKTEGTIPPRGGFIEVHTFVGHEFSYDLDGRRHYITPPEPNAKGQQFAILSGDSDAINVRCKIERNGEAEGFLLEIAVMPYWAPRGASRFLELVRNKYYDGVALNRVIPGFLMQFGIAKDYKTRMEWDENTILDDFQDDTPFEEQFVSFAGSGPDSRTTEIFIVMPGASQEQIDYFGTNSWEAPFGLVVYRLGDSSVLPRIYSGYGDMPPWGDGPDPERIYDTDGYEYLAKNFPKLDYIDHCYIMKERQVTRYSDAH